jgi:hypothetical protein
MPKQLIDQRSLSVINMSNYSNISYFLRKKAAKHVGSKRKHGRRCMHREASSLDNHSEHSKARRSISLFLLFWQLCKISDQEPLSNGHPSFTKFTIHKLMFATYLRSFRRSLLSSDIISISDASCNNLILKVLN